MTCVKILAILYSLEDKEALSLLKKDKLFCKMTIMIAKRSRQQRKPERFRKQRGVSVVTYCISTILLSLMLVQIVYGINISPHKVAALRFLIVEAVLAELSVRGGRGFGMGKNLPLKL